MSPGYTPSALSAQGTEQGRRHARTKIESSAEDMASLREVLRGLYGELGGAGDERDSGGVD